MINPNGSPGQELSIFFIRVWKKGSTPPAKSFLAQKHMHAEKTWFWDAFRVCLGF
jgi:hypothetical protein